MILIRIFSTGMWCKFWCVKYFGSGAGSHTKCGLNIGVVFFYEVPPVLHPAG